MTASKKFKYLSLAVAAAALLAMSAPHDADARSFSRGGSYTTGKARTGTFSTQGTRTRGAASREQSVTTGAGKTYNRSASGSYDRDTGNGSRTVTGWGGNTRTANGNYDRDTGAYSGSVSGENGHGGTVSGTAGGGHREGTYATNSGHTGSYESDRTRTDNGVTKNTSVTTDNGKTYTSSSAYSYDKDTHTLTGTQTGPKGNTRSGSVTYELND